MISPLQLQVFDTKDRFKCIYMSIEKM
jgi:hypothetical protein